MEKIINNAIGNILSLYTDLHLSVHENIGSLSAITYKGDDLLKKLDAIVVGIIKSECIEVRQCIIYYRELLMFAKQYEYILDRMKIDVEQVNKILKKYDDIGLFWE